MLAPATKCRHKQWCHGDEWEQHNPGNIEAVCDECAASAAAQDHAAYSRAVDADGYPIDSRHPANRKQR